MAPLAHIHTRTPAPTRSTGQHSATQFVAHDPAGRCFSFFGIVMATIAGGEVQRRGPVAALPLLLLLLVVLAGGAEAQQTCAGQLSGLAPCARYSVPPLPGQAAPAPGPECCSALGAVSRDCACETFGIINSLPAKCGLPPVSCQ